MPDLRRWSSATKAWIASLSTAAVAAGAILYLAREDVAAAVGLWLRVPTYNYCFLIPLISAYLIWQRRAEIAARTPAPSTWGIAVVTVSAAAWWLASAAMVSELRQFAVVAMLQGLLVGALGTAIYRRLLFPLLYLFLIVPTGTVLLPILQASTTSMASSLIALTGIPVYVEGYTIEAPYGAYLVAPGCAGLNFLLATIALGLLYARLTYTRPWKRMTCLAAGVLISVLANAVRVFGIIWLAEASHRQIDIVDDHLLYGWGLFSLVIIAVMAIGLRYADPPPARTADRPSQPAGRFRPGRLAGICSAILVVALAPLAESTFGASLEPDQAVLELPASLAEWNLAPSPEAPNPISGADLTAHGAYVKDGRRVELLIGLLWRQREGRKVFALESGLGLEGRQTRHSFGAQPGSAPVEVNISRIGDSRHRRVVWSWYWMAGRQTARPLHARLLGLVGRLSGDTRAAIVLTATEESPDPAAAEAALADFYAATDGLSAVLAQTGRAAR